MGWQDWAVAAIAVVVGVLLVRRVWRFSTCRSLESVYCKATTPPTMGGGIFTYAPSIYVPTASVNAYKSAYGWCDYTRYIYGYDF